MNFRDHILADAAATLERLVPGTSVFIGRLLINPAYGENALTDDEEQHLAGWICAADRLYSWFSRSATIERWQAMARAALLLEAALVVPRIGAGRWSEAMVSDELGVELGRLQGQLGDFNGDPDALTRHIQATLLQTDQQRELSATLLRLARSNSRRAWAPERFTDPRRHRARSYMYIIHALRSRTTIRCANLSQALYMRNNLAGFVDTVRGDPLALTMHSGKLFLSQPDRLLAEISSCSLISEERNKTYGNFSFGFVLGVPSECVCSASNTDMQASLVQNLARASALHGQPQASKERERTRLLQALRDGYAAPLPSPRELLARTSRDGHNEVLVVGGMGRWRVAPLAIFVKVHAQTRTVFREFLVQDEDEGLHALILACSRRLEIPVIPIHDHRGTASDISFSSWMRLGLGRRYVGFVPRQLSPSGPRLALATTGSSRGGSSVLAPTLDPKLRLQMTVELTGILQIPTNLPLDTIKRCYRRWAKTNHPDKVSSNHREQATRRFQRVVELLELLDGNAPTRGGSLEYH